jgi:hypothetical protein
VTSLKKEECEKAIRQLCHQWMQEANISVEKDHPSFAAFENWMTAQGYSRYLNFRSVAGADYDAEMWFDQETKQIWRR